jgi:hypothetical protein
MSSDRVDLADNLKLFYVSQMNDAADKKLCASCLGKRRFSQWVRENGLQGKCEFNPKHRGLRKTVTVEAFAKYVDEFFRAHYQLGEEYPYFEGESDSPTYEQYGDPYKDILAEELYCDSDVLDAVTENLPDADWHDISQGDYAFYDDTAGYESIEKARRRQNDEAYDYWYQYRFVHQWQDFCEIVQYKRRFFKIKKLLDDLFGKPSEYETGKVNPIYLLKKNEKIYRARLLDNEFTREVLVKNPQGCLGAPPKERARAGRMNVEYIPAFYGAFSEETAIAELRPGIGEKVAVGEFVLNRDLKVFDFTVFARNRRESWQDVYSHTRYDFISQLEDEISKPISAFEKQREYIPTQIVSEYLREHFGCEAVIYKSAMQRDDKKDNRNIVILVGLDEARVTAADALSYSRCNVKEIRNVTYEVRDDRF